MSRIRSPLSDASHSVTEGFPGLKRVGCNARQTSLVRNDETLYKSTALQSKYIIFMGFLSKPNKTTQNPAGASLIATTSCKHWETKCSVQNGSHWLLPCQVAWSLRMERFLQLPLSPSPCKGMKIQASTHTDIYIYIYIYILCVWYYIHVCVRTDMRHTYDMLSHITTCYLRVTL